MVYEQNVYIIYIMLNQHFFRRSMSIQLSFTTTVNLRKKTVLPRTAMHFGSEVDFYQFSYPEKNDGRTKGNLEFLLYHAIPELGH